MMVDSKSQLRKEMKEVKRSLSSQYKAEASERIFNAIERMSEFISARKVMIYHSLSDEVITHDVISRWAKDKMIYLPIVVGEDIVVARYSTDNDMQIGDFGILEPPRELIVPESEIAEIDICIIPAVALSRRGERLGRGKGYYDRFLANRSLTKIGVCYNDQLVDSIPVETTDILMNYVVTDKEIISLG